MTVVQSMFPCDFHIVTPLKRTFFVLYHIGVALLGAVNHRLIFFNYIIYCYITQVLEKEGNTSTPWRVFRVFSWNF